MSATKRSTLERNRKTTNTLVLRSPFTGVVEDVPVKPGMSIKMGDRLIGVMDQLEQVRDGIQPAAVERFPYLMPSRPSSRFDRWSF